jgi:hypothetical protein
LPDKAKIAACGSSYRDTFPVGAAEGCDLFLAQKSREITRRDFPANVPDSI